MVGVALLTLFLAACGSNGPPQSENYGNILASPGVCSTATTVACDHDGDCPPTETCNGLILVQKEHPTGWGRPHSDCFTCHEIRNIHTVNRTGLPDDEADLAGVRTIVRNQGDASCPLCHGLNGVSP